MFSQSVAEFINFTTITNILHFHRKYFPSTIVLDDFNKKQVPVYQHTSYSSDVKQVTIYFIKKSWSSHNFINIRYKFIIKKFCQPLFATPQLSVCVWHSKWVLVLSDVRVNLQASTQLSRKSIILWDFLEY